MKNTEPQGELGVSKRLCGSLQIMSMLDTSPTAEAIQVEVQRKLSGVQRLAIAFEMSQVARDLALARLRALHPGRSDSELKKELLCQQFPPDKVASPLR